MNSLGHAQMLLAQFTEDRTGRQPFHDLEEGTLAALIAIAEEAKEANALLRYQLERRDGIRVLPKS